MELAGAGGVGGLLDEAVGKIEASRLQVSIAAGLYLSFVAKSVHYERRHCAVRLLLAHVLHAFLNLTVIQGLQLVV